MSKTKYHLQQEQNDVPLLCLSGDPQQMLSKALEQKNLKKFQVALQQTAQADLHPTSNDHEKLSIFEKCLQSPGHGEFIIECIRSGCDVNQLNEIYNKAPANFVAESGDPENVRALLTDSSVNVDRAAANLTPLHLLATNIREDSFTQFFECIKLLIDYGANVNIPNRRSCHPILTILTNKLLRNEQKLEIIKYFLENSTVNLDSYPPDGKTRKQLQIMFPDLILPEPIDTSTEWDFSGLKLALENEQIAEFLYGFNTLEEKLSDLELNELLVKSVQKGNVETTKKILDAGADVNYIKDKHSVIDNASIFGKWEILKLLLSYPEIKCHQALIHVIKNMDDILTQRDCNYIKCFNLLIKSKSINVNEMDMFGDTALHWAVKYNNKVAIAALLNRGAFLGTRNVFNDFSITDIDPKLLEKHFDNCITANNNRSGDSGYEIRFNYSNLVPVNSRQDNQDDGIKKSSSSPSTLATPHHLKQSDEMTSIEYIAKTNDLKHLIKHPLIASFLFLKWHRLAFIFYANFLLYSIYCITLISYLLFCYGQPNAPKGLPSTLYCLTILGTGYVICREFVQFIMSPKEYLRNKENYLELILIAMTLVVLIKVDPNESARRTIAAITILLAVSEFFLLTGSLPVVSFSTHLVMLKTVSKSFLRGLLLYSIILIAFALCFYTLLGEDPKPEDLMATVTTTLPSAVKGVGVDDAVKPEDKKDDDEFNKFAHPGLSMIKTVVMLTGEFDASSINFKHNVSSYFIFVIFVFFISTVLFNLLNGLAVSDTQAIKNEAELTHFIYRAEIIAKYEKHLLGRAKNKLFSFWSSQGMCLFPNYLPKNMITILPNNNNLVQIPMHSSTETNSQSNNGKKDYWSYDIEPPAAVGGIGGNNKNYRDLKYEVQMLGCCCMGDRCSRMEAKIVKYAKAVLEKKLLIAEADEQNEMINQRMAKMEENIRVMSNNIDKLVKHIVKN